MTIFHHLFTNIEKLSIVTPIELEKFSFYIPTKDHPPHWGTKAKKNLLSSYKRSNALCWKVNMRKNGVPKAVKLTPSRNMSKQKQSENAGKGTQTKCRGKMN